jgi:cytoskeletal protein RodZ
MKAGNSLATAASQPRPRRELTSVQLVARMHARERVATMRLRARRIRRSVVALAATVFTATFLVVYVQMASGHDPALTAAVKRSAAASGSGSKPASDKSSASSSAASSPAGESAAPSSTGSTASGESSSAGSSSSGESSGGSSAVTTRQS